MKFSKKAKQSNDPLSHIGPLYHSYKLFGANNEQLEGIFRGNQKAKGPILTAYTALAIAKADEKLSGDVTFAELFCADGYYAMLAARLGAAKSVGYDNDIDKNHFFRKAKQIAEGLDIDNVSFIKKDMQKLETLPRFDVVANVGGLYHVENPEEVLVKSYKMAKKFLIIQTVVSMENNKSDYFETPAPGWTWGSRYSKKSFEALIKRLKYNVVDSHFNELLGNGELSNRGSIYFLIKK